MAEGTVSLVPLLPLIERIRGMKSAGYAEGEIVRHIRLTITEMRALLTAESLARREGQIAQAKAYWNAGEHIKEIAERMNLTESDVRSLVVDQ